MLSHNLKKYSFRAHMEQAYSIGARPPPPPLEKLSMWASAALFFFPNGKPFISLPPSPTPAYRRVSRGGPRGPGPPLEIKKQKKKGHQSKF